MFKWSLTSINKLRSTWGGGTVVSASSQATGYPKENVIDGNFDSQWKATGATGYVVMQLADTDIDYLYLRFDLTNLPTSVIISTKNSPTGFDAGDKIANNLDGSVTTQTTATLDGTSRIVPIDNIVNLLVGNTVLIDDSAADPKKYMIVGVGATYIEIDRFPEPYLATASVTVCPAPHCLVYIDPLEQNTYIKVAVTCDNIAHAMEVCAFSVNYVFDDTLLPLNPMPVEFGWEIGNITRTLSGFGVGRMTTGPAPKRFGFSIQRILRDGMDVIESLIRGDRFGILMDDGQWNEGFLTNVGGQRRQSSDSELVSYGITATFETV